MTQTNFGFSFMKEDVNFMGHYERMLKIVSGLLELLPHRHFAPCTLSALSFDRDFDEAKIFGGE
jgi:hypothetical protein